MNAAVQPRSFGDWLASARQAAQQPPAQPRQALVVAGQVVGSVAEGFLNQIGRQRLMDKRYKLSIDEHFGAAAWRLDVPPEASVDAPTDALNALAAALRDEGLCGPWRDEQLAVCNPAGEVVGTVERGAVRVLGIATRAVHLVGLAPDGRMWVQKRSMAKPNNPGLWDTLMGGMVSAADSLPQALARETWEEAGLRVETLVGLQHGGHVDFSRPSREGGGAGYMRERIDWFRAQVPEGVEPANQDGEVDHFELLQPEGVRLRVAQGLFTLEAGLVIAGFLGM
ncbi:8-oxo-dGTP pyrophosphatase MutT (NUDIX family) [Acidovorax sp. 62]|uniref:NUDIX hydrolase n=1 Tax=Acidovorax sp. 62 TaxID=2035203 RepID=UPI000C1799D9|nr:NUDIX domain-containing protein [Acidovorax sp. 62]PIF89587.1 8-oxo-dGTP pyrophosphatase MutT (NUDIX family) [Acidovorax sp. 62]